MTLGDFLAMLFDVVFGWPLAGIVIAMIIVRLFSR